MRTALRRIRGVFGMGVTWSVAWSFAGSMARWVFGVNTDAPLPLLFGVFGFVAGVTFSAVLALSERHRRFDQLSLPRFAAWGATGGVLLSAVFANAGSLAWGDVLAIAPTLAVASALCASGSLALARRAATHQLLESAGDSDDAQLTAHQKRKLREGGG